MRRPRVRNDAQRLQARDACIADRVVALVVATAVLAQPRLGHLQRPMRRGVSRVREERFAVVLVRVDVFDQLLRVKIGGVEDRGRAARPAGLPRLTRLHVHAIRRVVLRTRRFVREVIARGAAKQVVAALEAPLIGRLSDVAVTAPTMPEPMCHLPAMYVW